MGDLIGRIRDRMDHAAERMAAFQTKLFLNLFYVLVVPFAHVWLRITRRLHHENTGFFQETGGKSTDLEDYLQQH